jgi:hypothetical protein
MAFTDHCDLYGAVHEDGVNKVFAHLARQRPSLVNYATADVAANPKLWCRDVPHTADVTKHNNPLFTIMDPLPLFGADAPPVAIGYCAQLTRAQIDFHEGNTIQLPAELQPPLPKQRFAVALQFCAGLACPDPALVDRLPVERPGRGDKPADRPPIVLPGVTRCFCLDVYAIGQVRRDFVLGREVLLGRVDDLDIVDIKPDALEDAIVCYLKTTLNVVLREKLTVALQTLFLSFPLFGTAHVTLTPTPDPPVPNNPAIEDDQLKAFLTMKVTP